MLPLHRGPHVGVEKRIVVDAVLLREDIRVAVNEFLKPVIRFLGVARAVKPAVRLVETALEHLEDLRLPGNDLVAVAVLDAHAAQPVHVLPVVRAETMHPLAEERRGVVAADAGHER